ncbi:MAG: hypothetical protein FH750_03080 [Pseudomonas stutzeri]|jgi:ABC-type phosphate transport system auxiliary subunit|uniref:DUF5384 family protein n=1 Tax=Stutzerimonas stutzeri TaxID=316 RepID=UPI0002FFECD6|nr:DUF5384 family protein [Stutzerimonas stutzeri]MBO0641116.1 DUF5384 family protein [Stutzerimonas stutzeri]MDH0118489.1 DUF5384 family protein [Stutzerimonas stutzeri]MTI90347.1 hypothetical protein [Stutzerimonas stutzeri]OCX59405.1 hypothetical protein BFM99_04820 [Stutzerimonas stutzeri]
MKFALLATTALLVSLPVAANQFDQLYRIEQQTKQAEAAAEAERIREAAAARARAEAQEETERRQRAAAQQAAQKRASEQRAALEAENKRVRWREEAFEDELRALELEERRLELQAKRARTARANDYIDAELRDQAARTDVIQSEADSLRNVTSGTKALLEDAGKAEVNRSKRLFD